MGIELDVLIQPEKKQSNKFIDIKWGGVDNAHPI
jgi:hypothetical protein